MDVKMNKSVCNKALTTNVFVFFCSAHSDIYVRTSDRTILRQPFYYEYNATSG